LLSVATAPSRFLSKQADAHQKLYNSNALKRGQLVVAFKGSIFYGNTAFTRLQQSLESGGSTILPASPGAVFGNWGSKASKIVSPVKNNQLTGAPNRHALSEAPEFSYLLPTNYLVPALAKHLGALCLDVPRCQSERARTTATTTPIRIASPIHSGGNLARRSSGIHSRLDVFQLASPDSVSRTIWFGKAASKSCPGTSTRTPLTVCAQSFPAK
jgi:hypothetical protein